MMNPGLSDEICDPACGTAGFLVAAAEYVQREHSEALLERAQQRHFNHSMFHGFDFDRTMLRIASMNMLLHEVEQPDIRYRDSLAQNVADETERYSLILANPPFAGSLDYETTAKDLLQVVKTKKTELLFLALVPPPTQAGRASRRYRSRGRAVWLHHRPRRAAQDPGREPEARRCRQAACRRFQAVRRSVHSHPHLYQDEQRGRHRRRVVLRSRRRRGFSLDDKRSRLLDEDKQGPRPAVVLDEAEHVKNNLPDVLARWNRRGGSERERPRTAQSFTVPKADIQANNYDLSLNRYKETVHEEVDHRSPLDIIADLEALETEIQSGISILKAALG